MGRPASRAFASAAALSMVLFLGGVSASPVLAQPSDGDGSSQTDSGGTDSGGTDAPNNTSTDTSGGSSPSVDTPDNDSSVTVDTEPDEPSRNGGSREPPSRTPRCRPESPARSIRAAR